jgi:hypothetical protein
MEQTKTKTCAHCGQEKPVTEFYKDKHTKDGLQSWCKQCSNSRGKKAIERKEKELLEAANEHLQRMQQESTEVKPLTAQEMFIATIDWEKRIFDTASRIFAQICAVTNPNESTYKMCREYASQFVSEYRENLMFGNDEESKVQKG